MHTCALLIYFVVFGKLSAGKGVELVQTEMRTPNVKDTLLFANYQWYSHAGSGVPPLCFYRSVWKRTRSSWHAAFFQALISISFFIAFWWILIHCRTPMMNNNPGKTVFSLSIRSADLRQFVYISSLFNNKVNKPLLIVFTGPSMFFFFFFKLQ